MGFQQDSGWVWDFRWRRSLFDSEIHMAVSFLEDIEGKSIQPHTADQWLWTADPTGHYSVKSAYKMMLAESAEESHDSTFEELWNLKIPSKVSVFAWRLLNNRLPTKVNLQRRHIEVNDSSCPFCRSTDEIEGHLFFHCSKVIPVWWASWSWVNMVGVFPMNPKQHFLQHILGMNLGIRTNRWKWWWLALTWTIWRHRNRIIFANETFDATKLMDDAVFLLWAWLRNLEKDFVTHYNHWSSNITSGFSR
ncbi:putative ribonuclease H protein [Glycine max]|nr:putative ribonuclease H protein [Glycine max]